MRVAYIKSTAPMKSRKEWQNCSHIAELLTIMRGFIRGVLNRRSLRTQPAHSCA